MAELGILARVVPDPLDVGTVSTSPPIFGRPMKGSCGERRRLVRDEHPDSSLQYTRRMRTDGEEGHPTHPA